MKTEFSIQLLKLIDEIIEDGELSNAEIRQIATLLKEKKESRKSWPGTLFWPVMLDGFADGKIDRSEAKKIAKLIQRVRKEWATEHSLQGKQATKKTQGVVFDDRRPLLPLMDLQKSIASFNDFDHSYLVDLSEPSCECPDFRSHRKHLPISHLSRCCKHIMQCYAELSPVNGWPSWLEPFVEAGHPPNPKQVWMVHQSNEKNWLISSANRDWANVYVNLDEGREKYGYNVAEDRWSYDDEPDEAAVLVRMIRQLT